MYNYLNEILDTEQVLKKLKIAINQLKRMRLTTLTEKVKVSIIKEQEIMRQNHIISESKNTIKRIEKIAITLQIKYCEYAKEFKNNLIILKEQHDIKKTKQDIILEKKIHITEIDYSLKYANRESAKRLLENEKGLEKAEEISRYMGNIAFQLEINNQK